MRDINRIRPLLERLAVAWERCPDLRLGQLIINASNSPKNDPFNIEDEGMIQRIERILPGPVKLTDQPVECAACKSGLCSAHQPYIFRKGFTLEKALDFLRAHNDGIYKITASKHCDELVEWLLDYLQRLPVRESVDDRKPSYKTLIICLRNLVHLKRHKDKHGKDDYYQKVQPEVWRNAEEVLTQTGSRR